VLPGLYLKRNIPITNGNQLGLATYKMCAEYITRLLEEIKSKKKKKMKIVYNIGTV
jgi:hypothetical protein